MKERDLYEKAQRLPEGPGVYIFQDARGQALYVGKAASLRDRVRSYLRPGGDGRASIPFLMGEAVDVDFVATATEQEALLLENTIIKKRKPRYNVKLKDDKSFLMLRLDRKDPWPWFRWVRRRQNDGAEYFGPYASASSVRKTLRLLHKVVPLRDCTDTVFHNRSRPCIKHQIGRCPAPCVDLIDRAAYEALLDEAVRILRGDTKVLMTRLEFDMQSAAKALEFERAQALKVQIEALGRVAERQDVVGRSDKDQDVLGLCRVGDEVTAVFLLFREGRLESSRRFRLRSGLPADLLVGDLLGRFYDGDCFVPSQILLPALPAESGLVHEWLQNKRGRRLDLRVPQRGSGLRHLRQAEENARLSDEMAADEQARRARGAERIGELLALPVAPQLLHCLDVSTIQGRNTVASRVAFLNGKPHKAQYRRFKIGPQAAGDDFAAMQEAVRRSLTLCLTRDEEELPDLLVLDGGRGQVSAGLAALRELGLDQELSLVGLAKKRSGSRVAEHATSERLFPPGRTEPIALEDTAPETHLVAALRDEAHRFAITYHRQLRGRLGSELDEVLGVGPTRRKKLLQHFGSLSALKKASVEELGAVDGVPANVAEAVHRHLHRGPR